MPQKCKQNLTSNQVICKRVIEVQKYYTEYNPIKLK